ncbi:hypothetical protein FGG77_24605 [Escherichia coli]|nr:hypothetical protein FGG77_24605 [Escherichia coli]
MGKMLLVRVIELLAPLCVRPGGSGKMNIVVHFEMVRFELLMGCRMMTYQGTGGNQCRAAENAA